MSSRSSRWPSPSGCKSWTHPTTRTAYLPSPTAPQRSAGSTDAVTCPGTQSTLSRQNYIAQTIALVVTSSSCCLAWLPAPKGRLQRSGQPPVLHHRNAWEQTTLDRHPNTVFPPNLPTARSPHLCRLSASQRGFVLRHVSSANRRIIFDLQQEPAHEKRNQTWRRWKYFCRRTGRANNLFLNCVPFDEQELLLRAFLSAYRVGAWSKSGRFLGERRKPLVVNTVREAASYLAAAF
jgi:hypothetical protein